MTEVRDKEFWEKEYKELWEPAVDWLSIDSSFKEIYIVTQERNIPVKLSV